MENLLLYIVIGISVLVIVLFILVFIIYRKIKKMGIGKNTESLESVIINNNEKIKEIAIKQKEHKSSISNLEQSFKRSIQNIGIVRFNPFKETGGNQSFAISITDQEKNGVVISSLYTRERVNVFAKPITRGVSEYTLTKEEQAAINQTNN